MDINSLFSSKYIAASDLQGQEFHGVIAGVVEGEGKDESGRPERFGILLLQGCQKGMRINKTNADRLSAAYGLETDHWVGRPVTLYPTETQLRGKTVPCVRVRVPAQPAFPQQHPNGMPPQGPQFAPQQPPQQFGPPQHHPGQANGFQAQPGFAQQPPQQPFPGQPAPGGFQQPQHQGYGSGAQVANGGRPQF